MKIFHSCLTLEWRWQSTKLPTFLIVDLDMFNLHSQYRGTGNEEVILSQWNMPALITERL